MIRLIWAKEVRAELYTWRSALWLLLASLIFSFTSYLLLTNKELTLLDQTELLWLLGKIIVGTALLMVTIDASSILTSEFEHHTAESLFIAPIRLRDLVIGKFLASLTLWGALYVVAVPYMIVAAAGTRLAPAFLGYVALLGTLGVAAMVLLALGIAFLFRSSKNALTTTLVVLLGLTVPALFTSALKSGFVARVFERINPVDSIFAALDNVLVDYQLSPLQNGRFLLPLAGFLAAAFAFAVFAAWRFERQGIVRGGS